MVGTTRELADRLETLQARLPDALAFRVKEVLRQTVERIQTTALSGMILNARKGKLRDSIRGEVEVTPTGVMAAIRSQVIYSRIHEYGGLIFPRVKKYLRIPTEEWRDREPDPKGFVIVSRRGNVLLVRRGQARGELEIMAVLKRFVKMPKRSYARSQIWMEDFYQAGREAIKDVVRDIKA